MGASSVQRNGAVGGSSSGGLEHLQRGVVELVQGGFELCIQQGGQMIGANGAVKAQPDGMIGQFRLASTELSDRAGVPLLGLPLFCRHWLWLFFLGAAAV